MKWTIEVFEETSPTYQPFYRWYAFPEDHDPLRTENDRPLVELGYPETDFVVLTSPRLYATVDLAEAAAQVFIDRYLAEGVSDRVRVSSYAPE